jgi:hypothetical protein
MHNIRAVSCGQEVETLAEHKEEHIFVYKYGIFFKK